MAATGPNISSEATNASAERPMERCDAGSPADAGVVGVVRQLGGPTKLVAVTGAAGFIGSHVVLQLLGRGYRVRAVVRDVSNENRVAHLKVMGERWPGCLEFASADILEFDQLLPAFAGVDVVVHTATIAKIFDIKDPWKDAINPAVDGTRNTLDAIDRSPTVRHFVYTSSTVAIVSFDKPESHVFDEKDWNTWSSVERCDPYSFGKTTAEKMVFEHSKGKHYTVSVINPAGVIGPCLAYQHTKTTLVVVRNLLYRKPMIPYSVCFVDVRDVAQAHVEVIERPQAVGQRYALVGNEPSMLITDLGKVLEKALPQYDTAGIQKIPTAMISLAAKISRVPGIKIINELEKCMCLKQLRYSNAKAKDELGIEFRPLEDSVRDSALSMIEQGFATAKPRAETPAVVSASMQAAGDGGATPRRFVAWVHSRL